jgi:hypothetical protein
MKLKTKERTYNALTTAAQMIEDHLQGGCDPEDVGEIDEEGMGEYNKACIRASKLILTLSKKYKT